MKTKYIEFIIENLTWNDKKWSLYSTVWLSLNHTIINLQVTKLQATNY